ncbi:MAG: RagB/SusD family nutrient uptake outer membrane protein [Bacteroidota bacterium]
MKLIYIKTYILALISSCYILILPGCKKFIDVDAPVTTTNADNVFKEDITAAAVLTGIYSSIATEENGNTGIAQLNVLPSLSADELNLTTGISDQVINNYYKNSLRSDVSGVSGTDFWAQFYRYLFRINSAVEGLNASSQLTPSVKTRLLGECYFMRAFCYFYLVNLYADVPLIVTTDYKVNAAMPRTSTGQIYNQIKDDLIKAQGLLTENYLDGTLIRTGTQRVRPNKFAATALLARVYLFLNDWQNAETQASLVLANKAVYDTMPLNETFLSATKESIWSLQPTGVQTSANTGSGRIFILPPGGPSGTNYVYLNEDFVNSFEVNDKRRINWINSVTVLGTTYHYAFKYKIGAVTSPTLEYQIVLRLAEQYLIRAEARAQQNKLVGINSAKSDIDVIRTRAGLDGTSATNQADMLEAILTERKHELFTEWGHRWFDLKRSKTIDAVMAPAAATKGGNWQSDDALYPIPLRELQNNPTLVQNKGY